MPKKLPGEPSPVKPFGQSWPRDYSRSSKGKLLRGPKPLRGKVSTSVVDPLVSAEGGRYFPRVYRLFSIKRLIACLVILLTILGGAFKDAISKIGGRYLDAAFERFLGKSSNKAAMPPPKASDIETGTIDRGKEPPSPPVPTPLATPPSSQKQSGRQTKPSPPPRQLPSWSEWFRGFFSENQKR